MAASDFRAMLASIDCAAELAAETKQFLRQRLLFVARMMGSPLEHEERVAFAARLIAQGLPRAVICQRVCAAFGVKKSTAYSTYEAALSFPK